MVKLIIQPSEVLSGPDFGNISSNYNSWLQSVSKARHIIKTRNWSEIILAWGISQCRQLCMCWPLLTRTFALILLSLFGILGPTRGNVHVVLVLFLLIQAVYLAIVNTDFCSFSLSSVSLRLLLFIHFRDTHYPGSWFYGPSYFDPTRRNI